MGTSSDPLRGYVEYLQDLGVYDLYRRGEPALLGTPTTIAISPVALSMIDKPTEAFTQLASFPLPLLVTAERPTAIRAFREDVGDCTRCALAYAGRRTIVFGDGNASARLMFVGEAPGAEEDASGEPFVGKAGLLLNNMIQAMGLRREQVYVANLVMCRPPASRPPDPREAETCSQFLLRQIEIVQPEVIVALGATVAGYLLRTEEPFSALRGRWRTWRGAKVAATYEPEALLLQPKLKGEVWKDLQRVMAELGLAAPRRPSA